MALLVIPATTVIIAVALVFWISVSFSSPFQLRLWGATYPGRMRGRVVGFLGTGRAAAAAASRRWSAASLPTSSAARRRWRWPGSSGPSAPSPTRSSGRRRRPLRWPTPPRDSIRALRERPTLQRVALAQGFFGGGFIAAGPLFALVYVDRLDLSLADVGLIGVLGAAATTVSFLAWGAVADRFDPLAAMRYGSLIGLCRRWSPTPSRPGLPSCSSPPWRSALSDSSIDVGIAGVISDHTPLASRAAAMSGWNAITGARGLVAPFFMSTLVQFGVVSVTVGL